MSLKKIKKPGEKKGAKLNFDPIIRIIQPILDHPISSGIILSLLGFFWISYFDYYDKILSTYTDLATYVEKYAFLDQDLYHFCKGYSQPVGNTLSCSCFKDIELYKVRGQMGEYFSKIRTDARILGKLLSFESFREIYQFSRWNNTIGSSEKGICESGLLVSEDKIDAWRDQILNQLLKEREDNKAFFYSLKRFFIYRFTDIENQSHPRFKVDIKSLPIYQNEEKNVTAR